MDDTPLKGIKYNTFWGILDRESNDILLYNITKEEGEHLLKQYPQFFLAKVRVFSLPAYQDRRKLHIDSSLFIT